MTTQYQPKTGQRCHCRAGQQRDNCPDCEGTGQRIDFAAIRARKTEKLYLKTSTVELDQFTIDTAQALPQGVVSRQAHWLGLANGEPLILAMDGLIRYARAYKKRFDSPLANDGVLGDEWLSAAKGLRGLLNGDGAVALGRGITTDSKDNGAVEAMFWEAIRVAGFQEADL